MTAAYATATLAQAGKFLSFRLGSDEYGVEILKVQEILGGSGITQTPHATGPVRGVVELRGRSIPVVDMRSCLHLPRVIESEKNCIIVADVVQAGRNLTVGLLVDEVCEVLNITEDEIDLPPAGGGGMEEIDFINGMGRLDDRDVVLVDVQHLLADNELSTINRMTN
jgi:purine-binding chemotaxis protein CheW